MIFAECFGYLCPLTYLENWLRDLGGAEGYRGDFVAHYLLPVLYPAGLTPRMQFIIGLLVFAINAALYTMAFRRRRSVPVEAASLSAQPQLAGSRPREHST